MDKRWGTVAAALALALGLVPTAEACHAVGVGKTGAVVEDGVPRPAEIDFDLDACEGPVSVAISVDGGTSHSVQAQLSIQQPGVDCLPWDVCSPQTPPTATFTLEADGLFLQGAMHNNLHATEVANLEGTVQGDPASFAILKPI